MSSKTKTILALSVFLIMVFSAFAASPVANSIYSGIQQKTQAYVRDSDGGFKPIDNELLENPPIAKIGGSESISLLGVQWNDSPAGWWDTDWEYRVNVTIQEPGVAARSDWPVDIFIRFSPPAFKFSIRVVRYSYPYYIEVPSQVWNLTYYNDTHLASATVTFIIDSLPLNGVAEYQIYWSIDYTDPPRYDKTVDYTSVQTVNGYKYTFTSIKDGWSIILPPDNGGKAQNMTLSNGYEIGNDWLHFGVTRNVNFSYLGYWGTGNTNNLQYDKRYILEETDPVLQNYMGVVFITYVVEGVQLYDSTFSGISHVVAKVDYKYKIYYWGIIVEETIHWEQTDNNGVDYFVAGWVFDQDDGDRQPMFNTIANDTGYIYNPYTPSSVSSSVSSTGSRSFRNSLGIPALAAYIFYWTAGTHTLDFRITGYTYDDIFYYLYDENGNFISKNYDFNDPASFSVSVSSDGYYFLLVGSYGDDNGDGYVQYDLTVDGNLIVSGARVGDYDTTDGYTISEYSVKPLILNITTEATGDLYYIDLEWSDSSTDLDLYLYGQPNTNITLGHLVAYSENAVGETKETISYSFTSQGLYPLIVYKESGSTTDTPFTVTHYIPTGFEFEDYYNFDTLDHVALFNNVTGSGIGYVFLGSQFSGTITYNSFNLIWYNDGNDSTSDYIYVAKYLTNVNAQAFSSLKVRYTVFPWAASGDSPTAYSSFKEIKDGIKNPLTVSKQPIERFYLKLTVNVVDNDNRPVPNAEVDLVYTANGSTLYTAYTNASGIAVLNVIRYPYNLEVRVTSAGRTYVNSTITVDYSTYDYTIHSDSQSVQMKGIVRVVIKALTNTTTKTVIQNGHTVFTNASNSADYIETYTNLTGYVDIYIPTGNWILAFNATNTSVPDPWDTIQLFNDSTFNYPVTTASINVSLTITEGFQYYLIDGDITTPPTPTRLVLYNSLTYYDVYWGEVITINVNLTNADTGDNIDGTVYYYVFDSSNNLKLSGLANTISTGSFEFQVNTTNLEGGNGYTIMINGTVTASNTLNPAPINIGLNVKKRPLSIDVSFSPGTNIYWNESLTVTAIVEDSITGTGVSNVDVTVKIFGSQTIEVQLDDLGNGYYSKTIPGVNLSIINTGTFTVQVTASKLNYDLAEKTTSITIMERPTTLTFEDYVELPWTNSYTLTVQYFDARYSITVADANITYVLRDAGTKAILATGSLTLTGDNYVATLDLSSIPEGTYVITIYAGKKNYANQTGLVTFILREHYTQSTQTTTKITVYYNETVVVKFTYYDTDYSQYVSGATTKSALIAGNQEGLPTITRTLVDLGNGTYILRFNTSDLGSLGSYTITVTLYKQHYIQQTLQVSLVVKAIPTTATVDKTSLALEWKDNITLSMQYNRTIVFKGGIENADNHTYEIYKGGSLVASGTLIDLGDGNYKLNLNTTEIGTGSFIIYVYFEQAFHQNQTLIISLTVNPITTYAYTDYDSINLIWGYSQNLTVYYNRSRNGAGIGGATLTVKLINATSGKEVKDLTWLARAKGVYVVPINTNTIEPGSYIISVVITKGNYTTQELIVTLTVTPVPTIGLISTANITLYWNDSATVSFTYLRTDTSEGVEGATVIYYYTYFENGTLIGKQKVLFTDANGTVEITFTANETFVPGVYELTITAQKTNYVPVTVSISINVNERPMNAVLSSSSIELVWGDKSNITLVVTDGITGKALFLSASNIELSTTLNGSLSVQVGEGMYYILIDTTKLNGPVAIPNIFVNITKTHYIGKTLSFSLSVSQVVVEATLSGPQSVTLSPISGGSTTYKAGLFDKSRGGVPITTASVKLVISTGANSYSLEMTSIEGEPGYYQATVDWTNLPIFRPGEDYSVSIRVESLQVNGVSVPEDMIGTVVNVDVKGTTSTSVDYYGGTTELPGLGRVPALIAYPVLAIVLVVGTLVAYKVITYMMLPPEVKEIDKLIKLIEKDNYEYEVESRDEFIRKMLEEIL